MSYITLFTSNISHQSINPKLFVNYFHIISSYGEYGRLVSRNIFTINVETIYDGKKLVEGSKIKRLRLWMGSGQSVDSSIGVDCTGYSTKRWTKNLIYLEQYKHPILLVLTCGPLIKGRVPMHEFRDAFTYFLFSIFHGTYPLCYRLTLLLSRNYFFRPTLSTAKHLFFHLKKKKKKILRVFTLPLIRKTFIFALFFS